MKKLLLLASITLLSVMNASAQCTPDPQYTTSGIYPNQATGFVSGCVGVPYSQLVTNVVPADTTVTLVPGFPVTLPINDVEITSFTGLPAGFTVVYYDGGNVNNPVDGGVFEGGTTGCALITGTPSVAGTYNLTITVIPTVGGAAQAATIIDWYTIVIEDVATISMVGSDLSSSNATGNQWQFNGNDIPSATGQTHTPTAIGSYTVVGNCGTSQPYVVNTIGINENALINFRVYPNPAENTISIDGLNGASFESISFANLRGAIVKTIEVESTNQSFDISDLEKGVYFMQVKSVSGVEVVRFVKN